MIDSGHIESGDSESSSQQNGGPVPGPPRPGPHLMPRSAGAPAPDAGEVAQAPDTDPDAVTAAVSALLVQVDEVRQAVDGTFDLSALGRQTELLEQAHDVLTTALEDVDTR
ncbi:hypothetical protein [Gordonia insulae]|uniref:Uncharacterized protein n=1 Tax=Gordonia insulae TaxID=2420509 RepID=A0A3G8JIG4_9ACTN|nr:hypothetical protein [Gordonia insulae]AZG44728.1 hypothetical protein D7316_01315 [Gordonia insulae]